jgi:hypothetical protein
MTAMDAGRDEEGPPNRGGREPGLAPDDPLVLYILCLLACIAYPLLFVVAWPFGSHLPAKGVHVAFPGGR